MTIINKLHILQQLSRLTQTQLAEKIGVSFVAFNHWWTGKSVPHPKKQAIIDALYLEYTGQKVIPESLLASKKEMIATKSKKRPHALNLILRNPDIRDEFMLKLTYNSNSIEGSTLSENDTAAIIFGNRVLPNKSLREQIEAKNHQTAWEFLLGHLESNKAIDEDLILKLHAILMNSLLPEAGFYRRHGVRILGAHLVTANYLRIPDLMTDLVSNIQKTHKDIIVHSSEIHSRFEQIHPFADGNGRVGRLLMHAMLLKHNIAPAMILQERKQIYYAALNRAQTKEDSSQLQDFICDAILLGFEILERK